jgi:tetratricopeptide (TPR) repeat protein
VPQARASLWWPTLAVAGLLCFVTFYAKGGLKLETKTTTEVVLTLLSALAIAAVALLGPGRRPLYGAWACGLLLAFTVLTVLSIVWSVQPDASFRDAGRILAYSAFFAAAIALVRLAPERWPAVLGGVIAAAVVVCAYALLTKVFPGKLVPAGKFARLEQPYGYWNAIGLTAAMGAMCCVWLGARRAGHTLLTALAYPALGLMLVTLALAYSRGALAALALGVIAWFALVPLRLRSAAVLLTAGVCAAAVAGWAFSKHALSSEGVTLAARAPAGHELGALLLVMLVVLTLAGLGLGFGTYLKPLTRSVRRNAGWALVAALVIAVLAFAGALAHSHRGFGGSISHTVDSLTDPNAKQPPNTPDRLTAVASVRARYWKEGLQIFSAHPWLGVGAEGYEVARLRYRRETAKVQQAHGFIVQTLADFGVVGLALALALLAAWMAAAGRATHPFNRRWTRWGEWLRIRTGGRPRWQHWPQPYTPERVGLLAMLCVVIVFGVHSLVDWTWYVPGDACVALLFAGWLAGRGPLQPLAAGDGGLPGAQPRKWRAVGGALRRGAFAEVGWARLATAAAVVVAALLAAWSQLQPQRSVDAAQAALSAARARNSGAALASARTAVARDPLSAEALFTLAEVQLIAGQPLHARATLQKAVRLQPSNPQTWLELARFDLQREPRAALRELQAVIYLDPELSSPEALATDREAIEVHNDYLQALRATAVRSVPAPAERLARVEAQVLAERVHALREGPPRQREAQQGATTVCRRAQQHAPARTQHAAQLGQPGGGVGDVLDHLARPDDVEAGVRQWPARFAAEQRRRETRHAGPRAAQRLLGDIRRDDLRAGADQRGRELTFAAAEVEHALARLHVLEQEARAQREVVGLETLGQRLPEPFVVVARSHAGERFSSL